MIICIIFDLVSQLIKLVRKCLIICHITGSVIAKVDRQQSIKN